MRIAYRKYIKSGCDFDGRILSYRQFSGMSADFQRSSFWKEEYGAFLTGDDYLRYPKWTRHKFTVDIPQGIDGNGIDNDTRATFHTHWADGGIKVTMNGKHYKTVLYHSNMDIDVDRYLGINSIVINKSYTSFHTVSPVSPGPSVHYPGFIRDSMYFYGF